ncbi:uncharacterized protein LOC119011158 isoform X5 [Acanthopagrus latus]|uniref:uncharacterized protein LOC119011158 isoform X5 n=1 Tax=Acanthopagrus latus TaxID=8177 RepID=UPI00187BE2D1|nr:uncharacterized protein LOC119011158 isoform X5 [Acanthopagrus latus]
MFTEWTRTFHGCHGSSPGASLGPDQNICKTPKYFQNISTADCVRISTLVQDPVSLTRGLCQEKNSHQQRAEKALQTDACPPEKMAQRTVRKVILIEALPIRPQDVRLRVPAPASRSSCPKRNL